MRTYYVTVRDPDRGGVQRTWQIRASSEGAADLEARQRYFGPFGSDEEYTRLQVDCGLMPDD